MSPPSTAAWLTCVLLAASGCGDRTAIDAETRAPTDSGLAEASVLPPIDAAGDGGIACGSMTCAQGAICVTTVEGSFGLNDLSFATPPVAADSDSVKGTTG